MTNQSFDNQVKQKLSDHESPVPAGVWEAIEEKKKKRRYPFFWWLFAGSILTAGVIGFSDRMKKTSSRKMAVVEAKQATSKTVEVMPTANASTQEFSPATGLQANKNDSILSANKKNHNTEIGRPALYDKKDIPVSQHEDVNASQFPGIRMEPVRTKESSHKVSMSSDDNKPVAKTISRVREERSVPVQHLAGNVIAEEGITKMEKERMNRADTLAISEKTMDAGSIADYLDKNRTDTSMQVFAKKSYSIAVNDHLSKITWKPDSTAQMPVQEPMIAKNRVAKKPRWSVDVGVSPFIPVRQNLALLSLDRTMIAPMHIAEYKAGQVNIHLQPSLSYTIALSKKIARRWFISAGLQYGVIKEQLQLSGTEKNTKFQIVQRLENGSGGPFLRIDTIATVTSGTRIIDAINSYRFLDIPLSLQYTLVDKARLSLRWTVGINFGLYSRYNNSIEGKLQPLYVSGSDGSNRSVSRAEISTGFRLSQLVFKRASVFAEPYLRFNAGNYRGSIFNNRRIHQVGIGVGVTFEIGNSQ